MRLLIIRHAVAVPSGTPGVPDDERPLTARGKRLFGQAARGLVRLTARPAVLLTSPLPRAVETAEIVARVWGRLEPQPEPALAGGSLDRVLAVVNAHAGDRSVVLVGHEPQLSALLAFLVGSSRGERLEFQKGGAALVDLPGSVGDGGRLIWFLPPRMLRGLARRRSPGQVDPANPETQTHEGPRPARVGREDR